MSTNKQINSSSKTSSSCRYTPSRSSSGKSTKYKVTNPKRVLPSKKVPQYPSNDRKACSTGLINDCKKPTKPKKTTKSDFSVIKEVKGPIDFCQKCGDAVCSSSSSEHPATKSSLTATSIRKNIPNKNTKTKSIKVLTKPIQQYYKNENYRPSTESLEEIANGTKKISLDTIKEVSEIHPSESVLKIYPDSDDDVTFLDTDDQDTLQKLKEFRQKNYFECHSAKSRIKNRGSATSLQDHRCVYRFYLNDRLFPVPLSSDHNNQVRCVECHLPMELNVEETSKINGTIQAKVTIGNKNQDAMLLLPVKEPLIITEKRKIEKQKTEVVFFGVINLDGLGNSLFNSTLPNNSFALKYQKGYKEFDSKEDYSYRDLDRADVIVI